MPPTQTIIKKDRKVGKKEAHMLNKEMPCELLCSCPVFLLPKPWSASLISKIRLHMKCELETILKSTYLLPIFPVTEAADIREPC